MGIPNFECISGFLDVRHDACLVLLSSNDFTSRDRRVEIMSAAVPWLFFINPLSPVSLSHPLYLLLSHLHSCLYLFA
jgi:hypothetical protein